VLAAIALVVLATVSLSNRKQEPDATVSTVRDLNSHQVRLYWEGVLVRSPASITLHRTEVRVNGVGRASPVPPDTLGANARLAPLLRGNRMVDSLVRAGSDYLEAANRYGCEMIRRLNQVVLSLKHNRNGATRFLESRAVEDVSTRLEVPPSAVSLNGRILRVPLAGGGSLAQSLDAPDSVLKRDPCAPPSLQQQEAIAKSALASLLSSIDDAGPRLVVASHARTFVFTGSDYEAASTEIATAQRIYSQEGAEGVRRHCRPFLLPVETLLLIARGQEKP